MSLWQKSFNANIKATKWGGIAVKVVNKTGAASVEGTVIKAGSDVYNSVILIPVGNPDPFGIVLESGVPDGLEMWVTVYGKAKVFFVNAATRGYFARMTASGDTGAAAGKAISETVPNEPFATDKHFQEVGHILETTAGAGLALVNLHFN